MGLIKRGDIYYADLSPVIGAEQGGIRPVVIVQNDVGNRYSPSVIIAGISTLISEAKLPMHVKLFADEYALSKDSVILTEQIRTIDKRRLKEKIGTLTEDDMHKVDIAISISFDIPKMLGDTINEKYQYSQDMTDELRSIKNILNCFAKKYHVNYNLVEESYGNSCKKMFEILSNDFEKLNLKVSPLVEKQKIATGKITEQAVVEYFKSMDYDAFKGDATLDALKIDVIAKDEKNKIFVQVKKGQISAKEISKLIKNIKELDSSYDIEGLTRVGCACADTFPPNSEMLRIRLQNEYEVPIMFIHKYQVIKLCPEYKSTIS